MNRKYGNVCVSTGEFQPGNSDQKQKRWARVGLAFQDDQTGEISVKLETLPMPKMQGDGYPAVWLRIFREEAGQRAPAGQRSAPPPFPGTTGAQAAEASAEEGSVNNNGVPF
jgi:hypothetical protein